MVIKAAEQTDAIRGHRKDSSAERPPRSRRTAPCLQKRARWHPCPSRKAPKGGVSAGDQHAGGQRALWMGAWVLIPALPPARRASPVYASVSPFCKWR